MINSETHIEAPARRKLGRPATGQKPIMFARVPPAMLQAVRRESEKRGIVASAFIRQAIELALSKSEESAVA